MDRIAMVTFDDVPDLSVDDRLVLAPLRELDIQAEPVVWDDPEAHWNRFDAAVLRSCWDYHRRPDLFRDWLEIRERRGPVLWNPPGLVRWNLEKVYLNRLAAAGIPVVPTALVKRGSRQSIPDLMESRGWTEAVVKPAVSASAWRTHRTNRDDAARKQGDFDEIHQEADILVQEFFPEIQAEGEWSLIFLGAEYSHSVLKRPRTGDFRVQEELGATLAAKTPARTLLDQASRVIKSLPSRSLYARVDGVVREGILVIMEVELIEPSLFLGLGDGAPERFARSIAAVLRDGDGTDRTTREENF